MNLNFSCKTQNIRSIKVDAHTLKQDDIIVVLSEPNDPSTKQMSILVYLPRTQDININLSIIINSQYIRLIGSLAIYLASSLGIDDLQSQGLVLVEVHLDGGLVVVDA